MAINRSRDKIHALMTGWAGVSAAPHCSGGTEYRFGEREIGHVHADQSIGIPFPENLCRDLVDAGIANLNGDSPRGGWVRLPIQEEKDLLWAAMLLRHSYELARRQEARRRAS